MIRTALVHDPRASKDGVLVGMGLLFGAVAAWAVIAENGVTPSGSTDWSPKADGLPGEIYGPGPQRSHWRELDVSELCSDDDLLGPIP
jgi:hypothetical protein